MEATRASTRTMLSWGFADAPIALFKTDGDTEDPPVFVKAGPNGEPLEKALALNGARYEPEPQEPFGKGPSDHPADEEVGDPLSGSREYAAAEPPERPVLATFEKGGDAPLEDKDIRSGIVTTEAGFIDLTDQLEQIDKDTKLEKMEVIGFIRRERVERFRIRGSYYLGTDAGSDDAPKTLKVLALLRRAIRNTERVAVVKWTKRTRQSLGVVVPGKEGSLVVLEMVWAVNVLDPGPRSRDLDRVPLTVGEVNAATDLATAMFDRPDILDEQEDDRVRMEKELTEKALAGKIETFAVPEHPALAESVDDLERLLELSVERA